MYLEYQRTREIYIPVLQLYTFASHLSMRWENHVKLKGLHNVKPLLHQDCALVAFQQRPKNCRSPRCTLCSRQQWCACAVPTPRTPAIILNIHKDNVTAWRLPSALGRALSGRCGNASMSSRAPWVRARCEDVVLMLYSEAVFAKHVDNKFSWI